MDMMLPKGKEVAYGLMMTEMVQRQHHPVPKTIFTTLINYALCKHLDRRLVAPWPRK